MTRRKSLPTHTSLGGATASDEACSHGESGADVAEVNEAEGDEADAAD